MVDQMMLFDAGGNKKRPATAHMIEEIYRAYPKHVKKGAAITAIQRAIIRLVREKEQADSKEAAEWLLDRVRHYARIVRGKDPQFIPHCSTWFNGWQYKDDETVWARISSADKVSGDQGKYRGRSERIE